jgi:hypothetical protein
MRPWIIVPFSRPQYLGNVAANYARQRLRPRMIVVETGKAVGACEAHGFRPDVVLRSPVTQSGAVRNTGMAYAQQVDPSAPMGFMDDDDVYGSRYVEEAVGHLYGRGLGMVVKNYTMIRHAAMAHPMQHTCVGEDTKWGAEIIARGAKPGTSGVSGYMHIRHATNATTYDDAQFRRSFVHQNAWRLVHRDPAGIVEVQDPRVLLLGAEQV